MGGDQTSLIADVANASDEPRGDVTVTRQILRDFHFNLRYQKPYSYSKY